MSGTTTKTETWSKANVRQVMRKVFDDLQAHVSAGICDRDRAQELYEELSHVMLLRASPAFQFQYRVPGDGTRDGVQYTVEADGAVRSGDPSGGRDLFTYPSQTKLVVVLKALSGPKASEAWDYLSARGWGNSGTWLPPRSSGQERRYAAGSYAVTRSEVGD